MLSTSNSLRCASVPGRRPFSSTCSALYEDLTSGPLTTSRKPRPRPISRNSSNSQRLVEVCRKEGRPAYLVDDEADVQTSWFEGVNTISITAGASAPEHLVERLIDFLRANGYGTLETLEVREEDVRFSLPPELSAARLTQISRTI